MIQGKLVFSWSMPVVTRQLVSGQEHPAGHGLVLGCTVVQLQAVSQMLGGGAAKVYVAQLFILRHHCFVNLQRRGTFNTSREEYINTQALRDVRMAF